MPKPPEAFLVHDGTIYVPSPRAIFSEGETPITRLIEGICAQFPDRSRAILRERIFARSPLTPACEGMIKVVAKRATVLNESELARTLVALGSGKEKNTASQTIEVTPALANQFQVLNPPQKLNSSAEARDFASSLKSLSNSKPVGCVLYTPEGEIISYSWNTHAENRALHAELNLIRALPVHGLKKIPAHSNLLVTLKPCAMCAAQILMTSEDISTVNIFYLEDDPGPKARNSVLMRGSDLWKKAGEPVIQLAQLK